MLGIELRNSHKLSTSFTTDPNLQSFLPRDVKGLNKGKPSWRAAKSKTNEGTLTGPGLASTALAGLAHLSDSLYLAKNC